jgi:carbon monoxide dehydrogenase subunit G
MELTNEFRVAVPQHEAWTLLTDVERIAPCMPGAELQEIEGDEYRGVVKVKVGPITAQYKGKASFIEQDEAGGRAVLRAEGRDTRGQGNANATITALLVPDGDGTKVTVTTDLTVTGRVAQFGRGVLADVSGKLLGQFVDCLEANVLGEAPPPPPAPPEMPASAAGGSSSASASASTSSGAASASAPAGGVAVDTEKRTSANGSGGRPESSDEPTIRRIESRPAEPVDLLDAAGAPVAKRAVPVAIGALVLLLLLRRRRRRRKARRAGD